MKNVITVVALSALTFTAAQAVSFDPKTGMIQETQKEIDDRQDKVGVDNWAYANQANGTATSALYFANKNHAALKETNAAVANQQQHLEAHDKAFVGLAQGMDSQQKQINENTRRLDTDDRQLDHLQQVADSHGADIRQNTAVNESQDKRLTEETNQRIEGYTKTNQRTDEAFGALSNHEDRIVTLEDQQRGNTADVSRVNTKVDDEHRTNEKQQVWITDIQTKSDIAVSKVPVFEKGIDDNSKRIDGLDRKTDQTAEDASYGRGKADLADGSATRAHERLDGVDTTLKGVQSTQSDHETRITNNTANIERTNQTAGQALEVGNTAYRNTQVNARNIEAVDRASIERSKAAVFESNAYTDATKAQLEQRMDQQYDKVRKEAFAGVAGVAAMSNMPYLQGAGTSIAVGTGFYKGASAAALGLQYQPSETDAFRISGSISNGGQGAYGAGFSHKF